MAAARKSSKAAKPRRRRKAAEPKSQGIEPQDCALPDPPDAVRDLADAVTADGGAVLAVFRDPLGGNPQILAALPIDAVQPTPYQRDLSETHARLLARRIEELGRFLDPVIAYRKGEGTYWTPNGNHRLAALRSLGAKSITALVLPDEAIAYKILALNTEKAHNVRERSLEVIRMARALAELGDEPESTYTVEFEEPSYLTLGICYERRPRFSGGAYQPVLKRADIFADAPLAQALEQRTAMAETLLEIDDAVIEAVKALREKGLESPYLKAFVVARVNPLRFHKGDPPALEEALEKMLAAARKFDPSKVRSDQVARSGGAPETPED